MAITSILSEFWSMFLCSKCHTCDVTWQVKVWHLCNIVGSTWKWSQTLGMISDIWNNVTQTHMSHFHLSRDITSVTFGIMTQNHWEYLFWPYIDLKIELMTIQNYLGQNNTWLRKNYYLYFQSQFYTLPRPYLLTGSHTSFKISSPYSHWSYQRFATTFKSIWQCYTNVTFSLHVSRDVTNVTFGILTQNSLRILVMAIPRSTNTELLRVK